MIGPAVAMKRTATMTEHASAPQTGRAEDLLLDFLRDHDAHCPVCGYNLRGLVRPICPECRQDLALTVGAPRLRLRWLFITLAPGFFSGIAACFMALFTTAIYLEDGYLVPPFAGAAVFGWCSGIAAVVLAVKRTRFVALPMWRQRGLSALTWLIHFGALVLLVILVDPYIS